MTYVEAKRIVWERLATTVENDGHSNSDWMLDESEDPKDHERLEKACKEIGRSIYQTYLKTAARPPLPGGSRIR